MKAYDVAIVGGGFAGIYSAWRLANDGASVALIESSDHIGGTMWSWDWRGFLIDPGTHNFDLRSAIGADFYSDILGSNLSLSDRIDWGSTTAQSVTHGFEMPDFGDDDPNFCAQVLQELEIVRLRAGMSEAQDYDGWLLERFGPLLAARLKPMIEKTIGYSSTNLAAEAQKSLGMFARPKLGSDHDMATLKSSDPFYDSRLGVSLAAKDSRFWGRSVIRRFGYPREGALRAFCTASDKRLVELGVTVLKNTRVEVVEPQDGGLTLRTAEGPMQVYRALWTLPDQSLISLLGLDIDLRSSALPVGAALYAFEVHRDDILGPGYLHDFSPLRHPYRYNSCGVYSGQVRSDGITFVMAEVPSHPANISSRLNSDVAAGVWASMRDVGYVRSTAEYRATGFWGYPVAYTLPLVGWRSSVEYARSAVRNVSERIATIAFGHRGRHAFMLHYDEYLQHELKKM